MFGKIQADLAKLFDKRAFPIVAFFVIICAGFYVYSTSKYFSLDRMTNSDGNLPFGSVPTNTPDNSIPTPLVVPVGYQSGDVANPSDLLPKDSNSEWSKLNPVNSDKVVGADLLDAKSFMGQVSQYKGIMNHDIRAWPVIEKRDVSPWLMSTSEPDINKTGIQCTN